mmetsp:Transcript_61444/g.138435  ORF Transcript_61444/g.138435 Transcript_61444/m.138435 type:complete len:475 (+) Transcript_61444:133-1557(+)
MGRSCRSAGMAPPLQRMLWHHPSHRRNNAVSSVSRGLSGTLASSEVLGVLVAELFVFDPHLVAVLGYLDGLRAPQRCRGRKNVRVVRAELRETDDVLQLHPAALVHEGTQVEVVFDVLCREVVLDLLTNLRVPIRRRAGLGSGCRPCCRLGRSVLRSHVLCRRLRAGHKTRDELRCLYVHAGAVPLLGGLTGLCRVLLLARLSSGRHVGGRQVRVKHEGWDKGHHHGAGHHSRALGHTAPALAGLCSRPPAEFLALLWRPGGEGHLLSLRVEEDGLPLIVVDEVLEEVRARHLLQVRLLPLHRRHAHLADLAALEAREALAREDAAEGPRELGAGVLRAEVDECIAHVPLTAAVDRQVEEVIHACEAFLVEALAEHVARVLVGDVAEHDSGRRVGRHRHGHGHHGRRGRISVGHRPRSHLWARRGRGDQAGGDTGLCPGLHQLLRGLPGHPGHPAHLLLGRHFGHLLICAGRTI